MTLTDGQRRFLINKGMGGLTDKERRLINYYELLWFGRHHVPTIEEAAKFLKFKQVEVNAMLARAPVTKALTQRGIPWEQHSQTELTSTQVAAAITVMNFADTRSTEEKLDQLGITTSQYYAWQNDPQFRTLLLTLADSNIRNIQPTAIGELTKKINQGDWQALKYYLDATGTMRPDVPQSEHLIRLIIEIIQKHVKDPATMTAIANDILAVSSNKTLEIAASSPVTINDVEFEVQEAQKALGI